MYSFIKPHYLQQPNQPIKYTQEEVLAYRDSRPY